MVYTFEYTISFRFLKYLCTYANTIKQKNPFTAAADAAATVIVVASIYELWESIVPNFAYIIMDFNYLFAV